MIRINNFSKSYGKIKAVDNLSLEVRQGEIFGLIGPDGAGKTTLMRSICTLLKPDSGEIWVNKINALQDISAVRNTLGYMPQKFSLYQDLSVEQNIDFYANIFEVPANELEARKEKLYHFSRLGDFKARRAGALSGGMKQKLALFCNLIHTPEVLILDEPTFGVDPVSRKEFWDLLRSIRDEGTTIFVSTAYMDEAEQCTRIALMHQGVILALGTPEELIKKYDMPIYNITSPQIREVKEYFAKLRNVKNSQLFGNNLHVVFTSELSSQMIEEIKVTIPFKIDNLERITPTIEDIFIGLMG